MLVNKTKLGYKAAGGAETTYTNLPDLKEVPDLGAEPELIDNTALDDSIVHNEQGIGDAGSLDYVFRFKNEAATDSYRLCSAETFVGKVQSFQHKLADGTTFTFDAIPAVRVSGGGVNDPQEFVLSLALQSDITVTNPA